MRTGTLKSLCVAAVACGLALPLAAQDRGTDAPPSRQVEGVQTPPGVQPGQVQPGQVQPGQTQPGQRRPGDARPRRDAQQQGVSDRALVRWIGAANEAEIRVAEAAQQQAESDQVKQFAAKMIEDHGAFGDKLRQAANEGQRGGERPGLEERRRPEGQPQSREGRPQALPPNDPNAPTRQPDANRPGAQIDAIDDGSVAFQPGTQPAQPGTRPAQPGTQPRERFAQPGERPEGALRERGRPEGAARGGMRGGNPLLAFHEEVTEQCAASTIEALKQKQGADFDHAFMHQQLMSHMAMLDTLKVAGNHASPNLKPTLDEAQQTAMQHVDQAKQILEQLENQRQR